MKMFGVVAVVGIVGSVACALPAFAGDLPKQGPISGKYGWYGVGKTTEVDKGHLVFVGEFSGPLMSGTPGGFLDGATVTCIGFNDIYLDGRESAAHGYCIATDGDGDKAYSRWSNHGGPMNRMNGDNVWYDGTGKYAGMRGSNRFDVTLNPAGAGISHLHDGHYELK
ncbi:MAG: hypothetical protein GC151_15855 [Betaproteobacteria bacterium]|nr:hypothetical protein [Betaproteobacteria bacterium]